MVRSNSEQRKTPVQHWGLISSVWGGRLISLASLYMRSRTHWSHGFVLIWSFHDPYESRGFQSIKGQCLWLGGLVESNLLLNGYQETHRLETWYWYPWLLHHSVCWEKGPWALSLCESQNIDKFNVHYIYEFAEALKRLGSGCLDVIKQPDL